jgi:hypothetical protein
MQLGAMQSEIARLAAIPEVELDAEVAAWLARVARLRELTTRHPEQTIPEFSFLTEKDWFAVGRDAKFETEDDLQQQFLALREKARMRLAPRLRAALSRFVDAHDGQLPLEVSQLAAFSDPPLDPVILARYEMLQRGSLLDVALNGWLLAERTSFDEARDRRLFLARMLTGTASFADVPEPDLRTALQRYLSAHADQRPTAPAQLLPFFPRAPSSLAMKAWLEKSPEDFTEQMRKLLPET